MPGKRDRLLADALHQVAVGGEHVGSVVDDVAAELRAARCRSAIAMPTALAMPWPSGPVVVSTPGVWPYSGWPGVSEPSWRKLLISVDRHLLVAEQMQQRVEQHRAVAGREHEAVAVGPGRIGRIEFQEAGEQHGRDVGRAHRQAGMAGLRPLDRVHRQRADGVRHAVVLGARGRVCAGGGKAGSLGEGVRSPREDGPASSWNGPSAARMGASCDRGEQAGDQIACETRESNAQQSGPEPSCTGSAQTAFGR